MTNIKISLLGNIDDIDIWFDPYMENIKYIVCRKGPELMEEEYKISPAYKNNITKTAAIIGGSNDLTFYQSIIIIKKFNL